MQPARADRRFTLAETGQRVAAALSEPDQSSAWAAIRDFLDGFVSAPVEARGELMAERPAAVEVRFDAYLAALAEHLAVHHHIGVPAWAQEPDRFLSQWWFPTRFRSLHAMAMVQSPASFRRRGIFVDSTELQRV